MFGVIDFEGSLAGKGKNRSLYSKRRFFGGDGVVFWADGEDDEIFMSRRGDETHIVLFSGTLDDRDELLRELKSKTEYFRGDKKNTAEIIALAYALWGGDLPRRLKGEYSLAVYSYSEKMRDGYPTRLFLSSDAFASRELFYTRTSDGKFLFSTELKRLLAHPSVKRETDIFGIWQMCYLPPAELPERTYFRDIYKLCGGHCAYLDCRPFSKRILMQKRYWEVCRCEYSVRAESLSSLGYVKELCEADGFGVEPYISNREEDIYDDMVKLVSFGGSVRYDGLDRLVLHGDSLALKSLMRSSLGLDVGTCVKGNRLNSFFPWVSDPYQRIELFWGDGFSLEAGMNSISEEYKKSLSEILSISRSADIGYSKKNVYLSLKHLYPEALRLVRKTEMLSRRKINFKISREIAEDICIYPEKYLNGISDIRISERKKDPEYGKALRRLCIELAAYSGKKKIFDFVDRKKLSHLLYGKEEEGVNGGMSNTELVEWLCKTEMWLREFDADVILN